MAVVIPLGISTIVAEGSLYGAISGWIGLASWSILALRLAWKSSRLQETVKTDLNRKEFRWLKRLKVLEETVCVLILVASLPLLAIFMSRGSPLWYTLNYLGLIIVMGSECVFVRVFTDESLFLELAAYLEKRTRNANV